MRLDQVTQQNAGLDELENKIKSAMEKTKTELGVNRQAMQAQQATTEKLSEQISSTEVRGCCLSTKHD
eukprot:1514787-Amphidinium_carterae.1